MNILALEPYYGGSHRAFLDGWVARSRHEWTVLSLPPYKWKWRMRHAAVTLAQKADALANSGQQWQVLFCSDMLNLAEFSGLVSASLRSLPSIIYFHENQLSYPVKDEEQRDCHFAMTNFTSALAATEVWYNSCYNQEDFLSGLAPFLKRMPDYQPVDLVDKIRAKSVVRHPGIEPIKPGVNRREGPARILWAARWEFDKNPDLFFGAIRELARQNVGFRLSVIGERFKDSPEVFETAAKEFGRQIDVWGFQESRDDYLRVLADADIFVSTADHEFFGIGAVEAIAAGAYPLLPNRLAYPELLANGSGLNDDNKRSAVIDCFYDGSAKKLAKALAGLIHRLENGDLWMGDPMGARKQVERFFWPELVGKYDDELERLAM